ncbi:phosphoenolpyruvate synthase [Candidatus Falkowbacteria bacterium CG_4_10_14_0_2_um_filter_41_15]|uniref:Phosphoenolpyruvate synthase n=4 Tax=Candidatus Falkowiibacteriota TaxID=1752728 RepID=A0A2G9ZPF9_9BACT|nr:MAG: phosphoenolpyruvate synthase [Candidatus Falkowbacteria bacterium CG1_02_41_21]PIP34470.1 MAG: phosphoenolpyruvate synthase [Candidatus Falkowbacteria bacterium CG23_combo_of_CG06-09_8_20_14_all_41_10]PIZ11358.1 MAG: phosphoenolpyruvate synthase [Candidatus Falkowbacteria bacterium CG_4_10_14_0_8_um_filter_41_36]PJA09829.1 MAG: phosphoenolpyruvate synthase [Candidatus Falkowbacteria bacterium CG_4_10_14_0_2_um_filter_41_15]
MMKPKFVRFFNELTIKDVPSVGGKNASLGEMYQRLSKVGVLVPNGFATTAEAYRRFLDDSGVKKEIKKILADLNTKNVISLTKKAKEVRDLIVSTPMPKELEANIISSYQKLSKSYKTPNLAVAVRSSATAEDLPDASFAGQQETFLNIKGDKELLLAVRKCIASLFTARAISYRVDKGFDHFKIALSVGVQKMIHSQASGVMFSIDTESGFKDVVLVSSIYGLGENIVQGAVNPDEFIYFKPTGAIISRKIGNKQLKMIYSSDPKNPVKNIKVSPANQDKPSIIDAQAKQLAKWAMLIEEHYKKPMDMEWALDENDHKLYIIQARPETVQSLRDLNIVEQYKLSKLGKVILTGQSVGNKIGSGVAHKIINVKEISNFKPGQVLVTDMTDPDWEPIMKIAGAIVTDKGGRTCHAAIVSRELGIPCIVGTNNVTSKVKNGQKITVSCAEGDQGFVYDGIIPFKIEKTNIKNLKKPKTKIMMNVAEPDMAFATSFIPNDGVGLARLEFIINNSIKAHPLALMNFNTLKDQVAKKKIAELTKGYQNKSQFFVDKLATGVAMIGAAFYPKDVIVRLSDFKSNEYANLIGGAAYEPTESNPMIGYRGANRYYSPQFLPAFKLECQALKRVRDEFGLTNIKVMVPFCRTVEEGQKVLEIMASCGLKRGVNGLQVYVMAEIPANIILAEEFAKIFDGFSVGSNDLTQLTLGIDRDSGDNLHVAGISNEKNMAVKTLIHYLITVAKRTGRKVGICGQAPSDFPDFAELLVEWNIDSISLIPDTVIKTTIAVLAKEKKVKR